MEKYLIHSNEFHLIDKQKIHSAVKEMTETLGLAAGSTKGFDLYAVVKAYFTDLEKRKEINKLLKVEDKNEQLIEEELERLSSLSPLLLQ